MKKSANSNMYEVSLVETWDRFGARLDGAFSCPVLIVSHAPLSGKARHALENSVEALGYGSGACAFFVTGPVAEGASPNDLSDTDVFSAVEGLDPLAMVITDQASAQACARAYRCDIPVPDKSRVLGRTVIGFADFESMLASPEEKQRAWGLLKRLPGPTRN